MTKDKYCFIADHVVVAARNTLPYFSLMVQPAVVAESPHDKTGLVTVYRAKYQAGEASLLALHDNLPTEEVLDALYDMKVPVEVTRVLRALSDEVAQLYEKHGINDALPDTLKEAADDVERSSGVARKMSNPVALMASVPFALTRGYSTVGYLVHDIRYPDKTFSTTLLFRKEYGRSSALLAGALILDGSMPMYNSDLGSDEFISAVGVYTASYNELRAEVEKFANPSRPVEDCVTMLNSWLVSSILSRVLAMRFQESHKKELVVPSRGVLAVVNVLNQVPFKWSRSVEVQCGYRLCDRVYVKTLFGLKSLAGERGE